MKKTNEQAKPKPLETQPPYPPQPPFSIRS